MSSRDKYHPNYKELYPGIQNRPEILDTLKKSDRKMEYMEVDLKRGTFIYDGEKQIAKFIPIRVSLKESACVNLQSRAIYHI